MPAQIYLWAFFMKGRIAMTKLSLSKILITVIMPVVLQCCLSSCQKYAKPHTEWALSIIPHPQEISLKDQQERFVVNSETRLL